MYTQADIRNPVSSEELHAHRKWVIVEERVHRLIKGRRKADAAELVDELHIRPDAHLVWRALSTGMVHQYDKSRAGFCISFAGLCYARCRLDILRAVHEAGAPSWLTTIPRESDPVVQFKLLQFPIPEDISSPSGWLSALTSFQLHGGPDNLHRTSLFQIVVEPIREHTSAFLEFALDVDPNHQDIENMRERNQEGYALLSQIRMRRLIAESAVTELTSTTPSSVRRIRASL